jgi:hypothetical protein
VGSSINRRGVSRTVIESQSGAAWTVQASPDPTGALGTELKGIACDRACVAVGYAYFPTPSGFPGPPVAVLLDNTAGHWTLRDAPTPAGTGSGVLAAASCSSGTARAVGYRFASSGFQVTYAVAGQVC